ncbi:MAG: glycosyltransferase family 2 protein [Ignavibacteria bacterium]
MSISVLISTYNTGKFITRAVNSILNQTFTDFNIVIIDDGSEDDTENIVKNNFYDKRISFHKKQHTGLGDSLNYGISKCNRSLIARLDADDIATPYRLEYQLNTLKECNADIISGAYAVFKEKKILYVIQNPVNDIEIKDNLKLHSCIAHSGVTFKKKTILEVGGYSNEIIEDYDLWLRLREKYTFHNLKEIVTLVQHRDNSISTSSLKGNAYRHITIQNNNLYNNSILLNPPNRIDYKSLAFREFHYGKKNKGRHYYIKGLCTSTVFSKLTLLFLLSLLPFHLLDTILCNKLIPRFKYYLLYFKCEYAYLRRTLIENSK